MKAAHQGRPATDLPAASTGIAGTGMAGAVLAGVAPSHTARACQLLASRAAHRPAVATSLVGVRLPSHAQLWWTNASGSAVVTQDKVRNRIQPVYGVLAGGRFVPLPGLMTETSAVAIAF